MIVNKKGKKKKKITIITITLIFFLCSAIGCYIYMSNKNSKLNNLVNVEQPSSDESPSIPKENPIKKTESIVPPEPNEQKNIPTSTPTPANTQRIPDNAPKLSIDVANKVRLDMTKAEVKNIIGNTIFEDAIKSGANLTALTIKIPNTDGGLIIGFDDDKVRTINRTYQLKLHGKEILNDLKKGMTMKAVTEKFGPATTENGGEGTAVFIYKYKDGTEIKELVVAFDENHNVLAVS